MKRGKYLQGGVRSTEVGAVRLKPTFDLRRKLSVHQRSGNFARRRKVGFSRTAPTSVERSHVARLALAAIIAYQKHLSPRKGFACAHRVWHGGASCSEFVRRAIEQHGLREAVPLARARFGACKAAAQEMRLARAQSGGGQDDKKKRRGDRSSGLNWCDLPCGAADVLFDCGPCDSGIVDCTPCG